MPVAISNKHVYTSSSVGELAKSFPKASMLLSSERDLVLLADGGSITLMSQLQPLLPEAILNQLRHFGNHAAAWYNGLETLGEPIKVPEIKKSFTSPPVRKSINVTSNIPKNNPFKGIKMSVAKTLETNKESAKKTRNTFNKSAKIVKISTENPRRANTSGHKSWTLLKEGMTVGEFLTSGGKAADLKWDIEKGFSKLED